MQGGSEKRPSLFLIRAKRLNRGTSGKIGEKGMGRMKGGESAVLSPLPSNRAPARLAFVWVFV